jgi:hypothetical protein
MVVTSEHSYDQAAALTASGLDAWSLSSLYLS